MAPANNRQPGEPSGADTFLAAYSHIPLARAGMRIGLLGGSFDPPHAGHVHISLEAIKRLQLDQLWWLVSPGNPLKQSGPWPLVERLHQCVDLVDHPKIRITALETRIGSPYTEKTLEYLTRRLPGTHFVWLMGMDNMANVHLWRYWQRIFERVPVAVLNRPISRTGLHNELISSLAAHLYRNVRVKEYEARSLASRNAPAWSILNIPLSYESSTRIRNTYGVKGSR